MIQALKTFGRVKKPETLSLTNLNSQSQTANGMPDHSHSFRYPDQISVNIEHEGRITKERLHIGEGEMLTFTVHSVAVGGLDQTWRSGPLLRVGPFKLLTAFAKSAWRVMRLRQVTAPLVSRQKVRLRPIPTPTTDSLPTRRFVAQVAQIARASLPQGSSDAMLKFDWTPVPTLPFTVQSSQYAKVVTNVPIRCVTTPSGWAALQGCEFGCACQAAGPEKIS